MTSPPKPDLAVSALLQSLNEELDRKKRKKMDNRTLAKMQTSVRGRLGPRINKQDAQISHWRGGGKLCGAIFMCNRRTWKECLRQYLFGLPSGKKSLVEQVIPGMKLFLFEYERRQLWGVFEAVSYGGMDIIPNAYSGGSFPCQVRVKVPEECVALYEEEFCEAIQDNYFSHEKFHFDLSEKQVHHLISLFERKYICVNLMHAKLLNHDDEKDMYEGCSPNGRLPKLLTNDVTCLYPENFLQHSWYSSSCSLTNGPFLLDSEEGMEPFFKNGERRIAHGTSESDSLVPLPNGALEIVDSNVASLTDDLGKGFHVVDASCLTCYDSDNCSIVEDLFTGDLTIFPENVTPLHSDRPLAKSVWARISGCSKSLVALVPTQAKKSPAVNPVLTLQPEVCTISEMDVVSESDVGRVDVSETAVEKLSVGFKRRRTSNNEAHANVDEAPSKQRRKIMRPSFEASADEQLADAAHNDVCQANGLDLNLPVVASSQSEQGVAVVLDKSLVHRKENQCLTDTTTSNVSRNCELESHMRLQQHMEPFNKMGATSLVCEMMQEPCSLALTLATHEMQSRQLTDDSSPDDLRGHLQEQPQALAFVKEIETSKPLSVDESKTFIGQSKQGGRADGGGGINGTDFFSIEKQGSDLQRVHTSSDCINLDYMAADSARTSLFSLAPCTPAKDFFDSSCSNSEQYDDGKRFSHDAVQEVPLTLELGNGARLRDVQLHLQEVVPRDHASDVMCKREDEVLNDSSNGNQNKESSVISLDCTSGSNLLNQVDLKSFLSGLQVSGIKLQLGASPCLILQLGDLAGSSSNVDSQDLGGATLGQPEPR